MKKLLLACVCSVVVAGTASASFTGFAVNSYSHQTTDRLDCVSDLYVTYDSLSDVLLNIFDANMVLDGGWGQLKHNDFVGGSWAPQFTNTSFALEDSFVTIGGVPGFSNSTNLDANWGGFGQLGPPLGAGWFNSTPPNLQGQSSFVSFVNADGTGYAGAAVMIGRFVMNDMGPDGTVLTITASQTNNQGLGTTAVQGTASGTFLLASNIPAPGALALLGLAGLFGSVRRRA